MYIVLSRGIESRYRVELQSRDTELSCRVEVQSFGGRDFSGVAKLTKL